MHDDDGRTVAALKVPEIREQRRDLSGNVFVDAMKAHEGIEDEQAGTELTHGLSQAAAIGVDVEPKTRRGDHLDIDVGECDARGDADPVEAATYDVERVLGGEEDDAARLGDAKAAEARLARCHCDDHVESQEGLAALGLSAQDPNGLGGPEILDEPSSLLGTGGEFVRSLEGQAGHERASFFFFVPRAFGWAADWKTSKYSFSSRRGCSRSAAPASNSSAMFIITR